ncbi:phage tail fiber protein [Escherichia coli]|nr:phage tail fiber protein [Escherichia coli]
MFYIDNDSGVTVMPPVSAQRSAIVRWFSEGDGNNVITWPGMDWFNIVQAELLNTLEEAGIQPDKTKLNQLALSIKAIMSNNALLIKNNLSEIKTAGASAQRTARENLDIYDASLNKKGLVQLTSATDSPSETLAATAKAVKIAMDNANARLAKDRNGADIPNKPLFIQNVGLQETVNKAGNAVQKTGDTLSGGLTFENDSILAWIRNTDWAKIGFKNDASMISSRSISARAPITWKKKRPIGDDVSILSVRLRKLIPRSRNSPTREIKCFILRPRRSSFQTTSVSPF